MASVAGRVDGLPPLRLIVWPYHGGQRDVGMGSGASALAEDAGVLAALARPGWRVCTEHVLPVDEARPEIWRVFELARRLAGRVRAARAEGALPVVLAGNCCSCLGTVSGVAAGDLGAADLGVVWLDAHADFDTPEDNLSGFTDVMGLAILTGGCWRALRESIPGFVPLPEDRVVIAGVRDLEPYQRARLAASALRVVPGAIDSDALEPQLDALAESTRRVYLHVDLDVLDAGAGRANEFAAPGGPSLDALLGVVGQVFDRFAVESVALTAYDPRADEDGAVVAGARRIVGALAVRAAASA